MENKQKGTKTWLKVTKKKKNKRKRNVLLQFSCIFSFELPNFKRHVTLLFSILEERKERHSFSHLVSLFFLTLSLQTKNFFFCFTAQFFLFLFFFFFYSQLLSHISFLSSSSLLFSQWKENLLILLFLFSFLLALSFLSLFFGTLGLRN